jgi:hypothetical protein
LKDDELELDELELDEDRELDRDDELDDEVEPLDDGNGEEFAITFSFQEREVVKLGEACVGAGRASKWGRGRREPVRGAGRDHRLGVPPPAAQASGHSPVPAP